MGLFKRFTDEKPKASKEELEGFKYRLKYGDDPNEHWKQQREHWEKYTYHKDTAFDLLRRIYKVKDVVKKDHYSKIEVWIWSFGDHNKCGESPIGKHIYMHEYGDKNPKKGEDPVCLACEKNLRL